jgi:hypothetical protein
VGEIKNLREENQMLKRALERDPDSETHQELIRVKSERDKLKTEIGKDIDSLHFQYKSCLEFQEELNSYIQKYLESSQKEVE